MALSFTEMALTMEEADDYCESRGYDDWDSDDVALRRGQDYIAGAYNTRWTTSFENDEAPDPVKFAIVEAALREQRDPGSLTQDFTLVDRVKREKVGPLETEYADLKDPAANRPTIPIIDGLLAGLIQAINGTTVSTLLRA